MKISLKNHIRAAIRKRKNYYDKKRQIIEFWKDRFEVVAFLLALAFSIFGFANLWHRLFSGHAGMSSVLEFLKLLIEVSLAFYFFLFGVLRYMIPRLLDPMSGFFNVLAEIKATDKCEPEILLEKFDIRPIRNSDDIKNIGQLGIDAWGQEQLYAKTRLSLYKRWYQANSNIFSLVLYDEKAIGYIAVLPLNSDLHFNQNLSKNNIDDNIIDTFSGCSTYIWIESIFLKPEYQNNENEILIHNMYHELMRKIKLFAKDDYVRIYAHAYFESFQKFFLENGFGCVKKEKSKIQIRYLPIYRYRALQINNANYFNDYVAGECNEDSEFFFKNWDYVVGSIERGNLIDDHSTDKVPFVRNLFQFYDTAFFDIADNNLVKNFLGKTFSFYTHSVYRRKKERVREHSLALSFIKFDTSWNKKYISCKFYTGTKVDQQEHKIYVYTGVCMFSKNFRDITMIFHPKKTLAQSGAWIEHEGKLGDPPVIIMGRILKDGENDIVFDKKHKENKTRLLALNLTTYSQHSTATISKIGLMYMDDGQLNIPQAKDFFESLEPNVNDSPIIKTIKLYLMRNSKVMVKTADKIVINNKGDIDEWMNERYGLLEKKINIDYELYYYKTQSRVNSEIGIGYAEIKFLENGVAQLTRTYRNYRARGQDVEEQYFGEINIRYNETNKKFLCIKFIKMDPDILYQHYREMFLILFWPDDKERNGFDYTRGIILGDRDVEDANEAVIDSNICVLCNPNEHWNEKINNVIAKVPENEKRKLKMELVNDLFLKKVIGETVKTNIDFIKDLKNTDDAISKIASFIEIEFDTSKCSYDF